MKNNKIKHENKNDNLLIFIFYLFCFVALIFEPLYYFGCNWNYSNCNIDSNSSSSSSSSSTPTLLSSLILFVSKIWFYYIQWDPLFDKIPLWLQVMCSIEVFIFGPLYGICAYGLQYKLKWLPYIALPFCGALFYSTIVYFAMEFIDPLPGTNMIAVILVNIPWSIFPILLGIRVLQDDFQNNNKNNNNNSKEK